MPEKNLRIFVGPAEITNVNALLARILKERGIEYTIQWHKRGIA